MNPEIALSTWVSGTDYCTWAGVTCVGRNVTQLCAPHCPDSGLLGLHVFGYSPASVTLPPAIHREGQGLHAKGISKYYVQRQKYQICLFTEFCTSYKSGVLPYLGRNRSISVAILPRSTDAGFYENHLILLVRTTLTDMLATTQEPCRT